MTIRTDKWLETQYELHCVTEDGKHRPLDEIQSLKHQVEVSCCMLFVVTSWSHHEVAR